MPWQLTWQDALAATVALCAVWYLARRVLRFLRPNRVTACGTCSGCGNSANEQQAKEMAFVPADALANPERTQP